MSANASLPLPPLDRLVACPNCDALYALAPPRLGERLRCARCHTLLMAPARQAFLRVTVLTAGAVILMVGAVFFPFLTVSGMGFSNESSLIGAALAFTGRLAPLSLAVMTMIVLLPLARFVALLYVLGPLAAGRPPARHARIVYRLAERLRPWSMAEVFCIGTAVALVKIAGLASVSLGPAFWTFAAMIVVVGFADSLTCRWTVWEALDPPQRALP